MQYPEIIKTALDYIEQNLKADITAEELAQKANYSTYHYYHLFFCYGFFDRRIYLKAAS